MAKRPLKHILLKLDPGKKREQDIIETLERLKNKGISHKTAVMEALALLETRETSLLEALTTKSDRILEHVQEIQHLVLQRARVERPMPREAHLETIGVSQDIIRADETDTF